MPLLTLSSSNIVSITQLMGMFSIEKISKLIDNFPNNPLNLSDFESVIDKSELPFPTTLKSVIARQIATYNCINYSIQNNYSIILHSLKDGAFQTPLLNTEVLSATDSKVTLADYVPTMFDMSGQSKTLLISTDGLESMHSVVFILNDELSEYVISRNNETQLISSVREQFELDFKNALADPHCQNIYTLAVILHQTNPAYQLDLDSFEEENMKINIKSNPPITVDFPTDKTQLNAIFAINYRKYSDTVNDPGVLKNRIIDYYNLPRQLNSASVENDIILEKENVHTPKEIEQTVEEVNINEASEQVKTERTDETEIYNSTHISDTNEDSQLNEGSKPDSGNEILKEFPSHNKINSPEIDAFVSQISQNFPTQNNGISENEVNDNDFNSIPADSEYFSDELSVIQPTQIELNQSLSVNNEITNEIKIEDKGGPFIDPSFYAN